MGLTITEKILRNHTKNKNYSAGDFILASVDKCLANDITAPIAIDVFNQVVNGSEMSVFNKDKIILIPDHFTPCKDIASAVQCNKLREFAVKYGITNYFEVGRGGIEHCVIPEKGLALPGELFIGADSHTCTYGALGAFATGVGSTDLGVALATGYCWLKIPESMKISYLGELQKWVSGKDLILYTIGSIGSDGANYKALEFTGKVIDRLSMDNRLTMANMAVEAGAKSAIITPDNQTITYVNSVSKDKYKVYKSDFDAEYCDVLNIDCNTIEPQVAFPDSPENVKPISEVSNLGLNLDQVIIGSCTNGRIEDLRKAAIILKNNNVNSNVRCIIIPGSQCIYYQALKEGLIEIFIRSGAIVSTPTCGPCLGGHMGILAKDEIALSTTNRNFKGRMGHPSSKIFLSNPEIAAASAIKGYITSPKLI